MINPRFSPTRRRRSRPAADDALPTLDLVMPLLSLEVERARRYERPLSFLSLPLSSVRQRLDGLTRASDVVAVAPRRDMLVICASECLPVGMHELARRLTGDDPDLIGLASVASLPDDGFTLEVLLEALLD